MAEVEADAEQRRVVAKSMHRIPDHMNIKEGYNLLILLYKVGILFDYNTALDAADDDTWHDEDENIMIDFDEDFNLDDENDIVIHSETGMITSLHLCRLNSYDDSDSDDEDNYDGDDNLGLYLPIDVPPIIDQLQSLESIDLRNCRLLPKELGNLPLLKTIELWACPNSVFENIPDGLQLASVKNVVIDFNWSDFDSSFSPILQIFSTSLEELYFRHTTRKQTDEILRALQHCDVNFRQSITTIRMRDCKLNEDDLVILRERFINLREIDVSDNNIKSLCGIENKIK